MSQHKLSILLPVRNEGVHVEIMLKMLRAVVDIDHEVLIIHDDADDDTVPVVERMRATYPCLRAVHNQLGRGVINAIKAGVAASTGDYVLIFAADEVGPVLAIDDMVTLMKQNCDLVTCTRYAHGGRRLGGSLLGGVLSRIANGAFGVLVNNSMTDATTGVKMFRRAKFHELQLESKPIGWAVAFEMSIKALLLGWKIGEVPIVSVDRLYGGKSTFRPGPWIREYMRWFVWGVRRIRALRSQGAHEVLIRTPLSCPH